MAPQFIQENIYRVCSSFLLVDTQMHLIVSHPLEEHVVQNFLLHPPCCYLLNLLIELHVEVLQLWLIANQVWHYNRCDRYDMYDINQTPMVTAMKHTAINYCTKIYDTLLPFSFKYFIVRISLFNFSTNISCFGMSFQFPYFYFTRDW